MGPLEIVTLALSAALGYLLGSISFAVLLARSQGVNIFEAGSGNPGATNVLRSVSRPMGYLCFLLDALKGSLAVVVAIGLAAVFQQPAAWPQVAALAGAVIGHSFSIFLRLRGGKGVATTIGGLVTIVPLVTLVSLLVWAIVFAIRRYVSLASLAFGLTLPIVAYLFYVFRIGNYAMPYVWLCLAIFVLIVVRHIPNIQRLLAGTERRAGQRKPEAAAAVQPRAAKRIQGEVSDPAPRSEPGLPAPEPGPAQAPRKPDSPPEAPGTPR